LLPLGKQLTLIRAAASSTAISCDVGLSRWLRCDAPAPLPMRAGGHRSLATKSAASAHAALYQPEGLAVAAHLHPGGVFALCRTIADDAFS